MTLRKLAELTGYSLSSVSKAFSGSHEISEEARQKIFAEAKRQGCYEKYRKEKYDRQVIAVLCPETASAHYADILSTLNRLINAKGATMVVSLTDFSPENEQRLLSFYSGGRADGIIVIGGSQLSSRRSLPVVSLGSSESPHLDSVSVDIESGLKEAVGALKRNGHQQLAFIGEDLTITKEQLFKKVVKEYHLPTPLIIRTSERFESGGYAAMSALLQAESRPTAVIAAYDYMAIGAISAIRQAGLRVPEDISIIGSDNIRTAAYDQIKLSTITLNTQDACEAITDRLFRKIEHPTYCSVSHTTVKSHYIPRETVAKRNNGVSN